MSNPVPTNSPQAWREKLMAAAAPPQVRPALSPLEQAQSRISGNAFLHFVSYLEQGAHDGLLSPLESRVLVVITDMPGLAAMDQLLEVDSPVVCVLQSAWSEFLESEDSDDDPDFAKHYHYWSVWHQDIPQAWLSELREPARYWVHEEGFMLDAETGRGAKHLWMWDGQSLNAVEGKMQSWLL